MSEKTLRKATGKRKPLTAKRILRALYKRRITVVRSVISLILLGVVAGIAYPRAEAFVEEEYSSGAASNGRALLRGAQIVATRKMVDFMPREEAESYLCGNAALDEVATASVYELSPVEISLVRLDENGIIKEFECVLDYQSRRYRISYDLDADSATPELLEKLDKKASPLEQ